MPKEPSSPSHCSGCWALELCWQGTGTTAQAQLDWKTNASPKHAMKAKLAPLRRQRDCSTPDVSNQTLLYSCSTEPCSTCLPTETPLLLWQTLSPITDSGRGRTHGLGSSLLLMQPCCQSISADNLLAEGPAPYCCSCNPLLLLLLPTAVIHHS
jgi:hypothetical protein